MERRQFPRIARALPVSLSKGGQPLGTFTTRDLGLDGLSVAYSPTRVTVGDRVVLHLETGLATPPIDASIVHRSITGIGLGLTRHHGFYCKVVLDALEKCTETRAVSASAGQESKFTFFTSEGGRPRRLLIRLGKRLDLAAGRPFIHAANLLNDGLVDWVLIDFQMTHQVFDSGIGMLMMMRQDVGELTRRIKLLNCNTTVRRQLDAWGLQCYPLDSWGETSAWNDGTQHSTQRVASSIDDDSGNWHLTQH